ncbi:MAG TPA: L-seryl-tRNA(Sec) selenium transferase [Candidatus Baltobacteraceae bacterium]|nr:L-seryl-tRNA(Sec) selenium transferase [Candidatus Baltobacteraceae bacterium]
MTVLRGVPAVNTILGHPSVAPYESLVGRDALKRAIDAELDRVRAAGAGATLEAIVLGVIARVEADAARHLRAVINATGTILHTNLGRAPLAHDAFVAAWEIGRGYSNLEYDLVAGERGSRYERASALVCELTGAADALVVNNCAAAVLLVLDTFARGAEVVVARNQLIEIGGGFRLPDVLARSGATLVEVGATNKVYVADYARAMTARTALLMRAHRSNYSIEGFVADVEPRDLVALGAATGVTVLEDLGSGALVDLTSYGLPRERTVGEAIAEGVSLVTFSGDKLLGGPQAGIIAGTRAHVARVRANPLIRALRVDKVTLALLAATLAAHRTPETRRGIPFYRMLATSLEELRERALAYAQAVEGARAVESEAYVGGGTLPHARIPSIAVAIATPFAAELAARLRAHRTPIVARIEGGALLLDLRTIAPEEDVTVLRALHALDD